MLVLQEWRIACKKRNIIKQRSIEWILQIFQSSFSISNVRWTRLYLEPFGPLLIIRQVQKLIDIHLLWHVLLLQRETTIHSDTPTSLGSFLLPEGESECHISLLSLSLIHWNRKQFPVLTFCVLKPQLNTISAIYVRMQRYGQCKVYISSENNVKA